MKFRTILHRKNSNNPLNLTVDGENAAEEDGAEDGTQRELHQSQVQFVSHIQNHQVLIDHVPLVVYDLQHDAHEEHIEHTFD